MNVMFTAMSTEEFKVVETTTAKGASWAVHHAIPPPPPPLLPPL